jgi:hypothetical protein
MSGIDRLTYESGSKEFTSPDQLFQERILIQFLLKTADFIEKQS